MDTPEDIKRELEQYRSGIWGLFDCNSSHVVGNSMPEHAALLYELFFSKAEGKVRMYCKNLCRLVFDKDFVLKAFEDAVERGVVFEIVITEPEPESRVFPELAKRNGVAIKTNAPEAVKNNAVVNFCVMDDRAYRFEENNAECKAVACFSDRKTTRSLSELFDRILLRIGGQGAAMANA